jgi:molecular chaperone DnaJ
MATEAHDLYELLGVARNASPDDIRTAYRALARQYHPDVNGDPAATERFKQIQGAYEILSDPSKRQRYDHMGQTGSAGFPFTDIGDIFEMFFGGAVGRRPGQRATRTRHGESIGTVLELTFEEAAFGVTKEIPIENLEQCTACLGNGCAPGTAPARCANCGGTGQVQEMSRSIFGTVMTARGCSVCEGTGEAITTPCPECLGEGRVGRSRVVEVQVPAGVSDGLELRVSGAGNAGRAGGGPGDLYVSLDVAPHAVFERRGPDLFTILEVPMTQAALGADVKISTLDREEHVRIDPGVGSGEVLRIKNGGVPNLGKRGRGDLFVTVDVVTPQPTSKEERKLLEQLAEARGERQAKGKAAPGTLRRPGEED